MKKRISFLTAVLTASMLAGCGATPVTEASVDTPKMGNIFEESASQEITAKPAQSNEATYDPMITERVNGQSDAPESESSLSPRKILSYHLGTYSYTGCTLDGTDGILVIEEDEYSYINFTDYIGGDSMNYRFDANESNCVEAGLNRVYVEYPEMVYSDDTAIFSYYILEMTNDGINVYFSEKSFDEAELIYSAVRVSENDLAISDEELKEISDKLSTAEYNGFLTTTYENDREIDWNDVLYCGANIGTLNETPDEEVAAYLAEAGTIEYGDILAIKRTDLEAFVREHTITRDYQAMEKPLKWTYVKAYDTYYAQRSEGYLYTYRCISGKKRGPQYTVIVENTEYGGANNKSELCFEKRGDRFLMKSNKLLSGEAESKKQADA